MSEHEVLPDPVDPQRRKVMGAIVGVINLGLIGAIVGPVVGFAASPMKSKMKETWVELMDDHLIAPGEIKEVNFSMRVVDGYHEVERKYTVFLRRTEEGVLCLDPACTHLGCRVEYQSERRRFICPCHGGVFDEEGRVKSGPPPKPMDRHPVKIEGGKIWISRQV